MPEQDRHVGCPHCCNGHLPTIRYDVNLPDGFEVVHTIRTKTGEKSEIVSVTICQAWKPSNA